VEYCSVLPQDSGWPSERARSKGKASGAEFRLQGGKPDEFSLDGERQQCPRGDEGGRKASGTTPHLPLTRSSSVVRP